jgi:ABC-type multidrug transport system ATPase subunit
MEPIIQIHNLQKFYGKKEVLHGLNLSILPGQIIGYIGASPRYSHQIFASDVARRV